jgi:hypothetical protein
MISKKFVKRLVITAACYNASALLLFLTPGGLVFFGVQLPYSDFWVWLPSLLALFASIVLFLSSRDLDTYAAFPYWNGIIRVIFAIVAFALNFSATAGIFIAVIAGLDLILGLMCIIMIPAGMNRTHAQLFINSLSANNEKAY